LKVDLLFNDINVKLKCLKNINANIKMKEHKLKVLAATHRKSPPTRHLIQGLNPLLWTLRGLDIDPAPLLSKAKIPSSALTQQNYHLSAEQELSFTQQAVELLDQPALGLKMGSAYHLPAYGILGMAIMTSDNLVNAAKTLFNYIVMTWTYMHWSLSEDNGVAIINLKPLRELGGCNQYMVDRGLIASYLIFKEGLGQELPLLEVNVMQKKPIHSERYSELFNCKINFDCQSNNYKFDAKYLYTQFLQADQNANAIYSVNCEKTCKLLQEVVSFTDLIRYHILESENYQNSLDTIADKMFLTPRTIQRKLSKEGSSFKKILEEARCSLAVDFLQTTPITIEDIASKLGYNDASAFSHAFKRWTGKSPRDYRSGKFK
jgi:AraC-like DNA-binding protein